MINSKGRTQPVKKSPDATKAVQRNPQGQVELDSPVSHQKPRIIFPVNPLSLDNFVGLGILLGLLYHGIVNWTKIFGSDTSDMINILLMSAFMASFSLNLGNLLYQLTFWTFRCYNRRLIQQDEYRVALERTMQPMLVLQLIFGLCIGGYLLFHWKMLSDNAICIPKDYCPDSNYMKSIYELRNEVCDKREAFCKEFFYRLPMLVLTLRAAVGAMFLQLYWEWKNRLQISMTVFKTS